MPAKGETQPQGREALPGKTIKHRTSKQNRGAKPPLLSLVVPVVNEAGNLPGLLEPLQPFRGNGLEVIVVDGGSEDGSTRCAAALADQLLQSPPGRALQMNAGAAVARGAVLWFVHADVRFSTTTLEELLRMQAEDPLGWGFFPVRLIGRHWLLPLIARSMNWRSAFTSVATGDQGIFVERQLFYEIGGYSPIPLMEDIALSKALRRCRRPRRLRQKLAVSGRRWDRNGIWRTIFLMWLLRFFYVVGVSPQQLHRLYYKKPSDPDSTFEEAAPKLDRR